MDVFETNIDKIIETKVSEIKNKLFEREQIKKDLHSKQSESATESINTSK